MINCKENGVQGTVFPISFSLSLSLCVTNICLCFKLVVALKLLAAISVDTFCYLLD